MKSLGSSSKRVGLLGILVVALGIVAAAWVGLHDGKKPIEEVAVTVVTPTPARTPSSTEPTATETALADGQSSAPVASTPEAAPTSTPLPTPTPGPLSVRSFGAAGDGHTDDTDALEKAFAALTDGDELVFPSGTYLYSSRLVIDADNLVLMGEAGAELLNTDPEAIDRIVMTGSNIRIEGLTFSSSIRKRDEGSNYILQLRGPSQQLINSNFNYAGILVEGARDCLVAGVRVTNSQADSIRLTNATNCRVIDNIVRYAGDDMISVVSTVGESPLNSNILIEGNDLADQYWGRGIAIVGGEKVTIRNNSISGTAAAAGILIAQESNYNTYGVRNVIIEGNLIQHVETTGEPLNGVRRGHGAITINADSDKIQDILIRGNVIIDTSKDGIDIRRNACGLAIIDNQLSEIGRNPISISDASCTAFCSGNTYVDQAINNERCGGTEPVVTGYVS